MFEKIKFIFRCLKAKYRDQKSEIRALTQDVPKDSIVIDVGSNKGSYLYALSKAVPKGEVIAFEPQPILASYLTKMAKQCNLANVTIVNKACSDKDGVLSLYLPNDVPTSPCATLEQDILNPEGTHQISVSVIKLDSYLENKVKISAVKIDVEGHELSVIRGMANTIRKHKPILVCEIEQRHLREYKIEDVLNEILQLGYEGVFIQNDKEIDIREFQVTIHQENNSVRFWDAKDYCNNFIFSPKS